MTGSKLEPKITQVETGCFVILLSRGNNNNTLFGLRKVAIRGSFNLKALIEVADIPERASRGPIISIPRLNQLGEGLLEGRGAIVETRWKIFLIFLAR